MVGKSFMERPRMEPQPRHEREQKLCEVCATLDIAWLLQEETNEGWYAGQVGEIISRSWRCALCDLLEQAIRKIWLLDSRSSFPNYLFYRPCYLCPLDRIITLNSETVARGSGTRFQHWYTGILETCKKIWPAERPLRNLQVLTDPNPWEFDVLDPWAPAYVKDMHSVVSSRSRTYEIHCLHDHRQASEMSTNHKQFGGRLFNAQRANLGLARQWLGMCSNSHSKMCEQHVVSLEAPIPLRLIDVSTRQLLLRSTSCRYVTLSYVWGGVKLDEAWQKGTPQVSADGSGYLQLPLNLPATLEDAISVTKALGEDYLWIDQLCIIQNDDVDKQNSIASMDKIYACSTLTIVAAVGKDANAGIVGVSKARSEQQKIAVVQGFVLSQRLERFPTVLERSAWYFRAWTYQEYLLSRRNLIFTDSQMFFQCKLTVWFEDTVAESLVDVDIEEALGQDLGLMAIQENRMSPRFYPLLSAWHAYRMIVEDYTKRSLTFPSDAVNALTGLLNTVAEELGGFHCGLPMAEFHRALLWHYRHGESERLHPAETQMPSWTWAGWKHNMYLREEQGSRGGWLFGLGMYGAKEARLAVVTYVLEMKCGQVQIYSFANSNIVQMAEAPLPQSLTTSEANRAKLDVGTSLLCLYTALAHLTVSEDATGLDDDGLPNREYLLLDSQQDTVGYVGLTQKQRQPLGSGKLICIILSYSERLLSPSEQLGCLRVHDKEPARAVTLPWSPKATALPLVAEEILPFATVMALVDVDGFLERVGIGQVLTKAFMQERSGSDQWVVVA